MNAKTVFAKYISEYFVLISSIYHLFDDFNLNNRQLDPTSDEQLYRMKDKLRHMPDDNVYDFVRKHCQKYFLIFTYQL